MHLPLLSLLLISGPGVDYMQADSSLSGDALRGFRPIEAEEIVMCRLNEQ